MNRPIIRIVATDGKAYPLAPAGVPTVPAQGTPATPSHGAQHVAIPPLTEEETAKVWARVEKHGSDECWPWIGSVDRRGRGRFNLGNRKSYPAPRLLWRISRDQDPAELCVCHSCDNPNCVNPSHLWLGTHQENLDDAKRKGRMGHPLLDYCVNGHEMSGSNVGIRYDGFRKCRTCESLRRQREKDKKNLLKRAATGEAEVSSPGISVSPTPHGPPTTSRMDGAGGAFNDWDCKIAKAKARGDFKAVDGLQQARAKINLTFGLLEPVWVPTESQLAIGMMLRVAAVEGVCTLDAVPSDGSTWMRAEAAALGRQA